MFDSRDQSGDLFDSNCIGRRVVEPGRVALRLKGKFGVNRVVAKAESVTSDSVTTAVCRRTSQFIDDYSGILHLKESSGESLERKRRVLKMQPNILQNFNLFEVSAGWAAVLRMIVVGAAVSALYTPARLKSAQAFGAFDVIGWPSARSLSQDLEIVGTSNIVKIAR